MNRLFAVSIVARLPLAMFGIGILIHAEHLTGSFAAAGVVTGAYGVSLGVGGPLLGKLVDRHGQTRVLVLSAGATAGLLAAVALLPAGAPLALLVLLAAGVGLATPPLGACLRTLFPALLPEPSAVHAAFAVDATAVELTWIAGPPLALGLGAVWSTGAALAVGGVLLLGATLAFAAQPASRRWRPTVGQARPRGGSLRAPAMRTLVVALLAVGVLFDAVQVGVASAADALGSAAAAGPLLAVWGAGSLLGGLLAVRLGGGAHSARGLTLVLVALTVGHLFLVVAAGSVVAMAAVLLVAGAAIAPTYATVFALVERAAPAGTVTEAFAWLATAVAVGAAIGAAGAGAIAEHTGPAAVFVFASGAGACALVAALTRPAPGPRTSCG
jgi:MFS family permease